MLQLLGVKLKSVGIHLPEDLWKAAKVRAAQNAETMREFIARAVARELKEPKRV